MDFRTKTKKLFLLLFFILVSNNLFAHDERVHQYIAKEAYNLLKLACGNDISVIRDNLGVTETGNYLSWYDRGEDFNDGKIVAGAFREDVNDIVYGYGDSFVPGVDEGLQYACASVTHFWTGSDDFPTNMAWTPYGDIPNAYQKIMRYYSGIIIGHASGFLVTTAQGDKGYIYNFENAPVNMTYYNLIDLYKTGRVNVLYAIIKKLNGDEINYGGDIILSEDLKNKIVFEILGRMSHLLADMSVPAHVHNTSHFSGSDEPYEKGFMHVATDADPISNPNVTYWNADRVYSTYGSLMKPYVSYDTNPLHMLMYSLNQIADHFASSDSYGNDMFNSSFSETSRFFPYGIQPNEISDYLSKAPQYMINIRDATFPHAIRAVAGLFYWFATEIGEVKLITVQNNFQSGTVVCDGNSYTSGQKLPKAIGGNISLSAVDQPFGGYDRVFNTSGSYPSSWELRDNATGEIKGTSNFRNTDFTIPLNTNGLTATAQMKRLFKISRNDVSEFDGTVSAGPVTSVAEQNSVTVPAPSQRTIGARTYNFAGWKNGGNGTITPTGNMTVDAFYKIPNKSNSSTAFSNTSQRKFVRTDNGYLHLVYESMNHIWYERSTDNGSSWQIMNGGKYLDQGATQSKRPSIATMYNDIAIVWQEEYVGYYKIILARFDENSVLRYTTIVYDPAIEFADKPLYSTNADPVIAFNECSTVLVCWKKEIPENSSSSGIWYKLGQAYIDYNGAIMDVSRWYQEDIIPGTTINSYTPTVALSLLGQEFVLAWEQREYYGSIKFARLYYGVSNGVYVINNISQETISNWSYYQKHMKPSIALIPSSSGGGKLELGWVAERTYYENGIQKVMRNALYRRNSYSTSTNTWTWGGTTWSMGSNVGAVNVNTSISDGVVGWNEGGVTNRYIRTSNPYSTRNFNTGPDLTGSSLQINNSTDFNSMYALVFKNNTLPYSFAKSFSVAQLGKTGSEASSSRIAIARLDSAAFFVSLSRLLLDGKNIGFSSKGDSLKHFDSRSISEALSTESFTPLANSSVSYNIEYGTLDTLYSIKALSKNSEIQCRLELQDVENGDVIKVLERFSLDKLTMRGNDGSLRSTLGSLDVKQFAGRNLRLTIVIEDGINASWGLMERVLSPEDEHQIEKTSSVKVVDYALSQNYPNPFNPSTVISYEIPKTSKVLLKVYDMLGKEVTTLVNEIKGEGKYSVEFNASSLPSGTYIYEIRANDFVRSGKMMLLK